MIEVAALVLAMVPLPEPTPDQLLPFLGAPQYRVREQATARLFLWCSHHPDRQVEVFRRGLTSRDPEIRYRVAGIVSTMWRCRPCEGSGEVEVKDVEWASGVTHWPGEIVPCRDCDGYGIERAIRQSIECGLKTKGAA